ncbi:MAG: hypothetical protein IJT76_01600, partial [Clostridia bacterium]|nr:hypothetical protein [Clostridia bacterium]
MAGQKSRYRLPDTDSLTQFCKIVNRKTRRLLKGGVFQSVKKLYERPRFWYNRSGGDVMEEWKKDSRREPVITDLDALVPKD